MHLSGLDLSLETTESMVRTAHALYRHIKSLLFCLFSHIDFLKVS